MKLNCRTNPVEMIGKYGLLLIILNVIVCWRGVAVGQTPGDPLPGDPLPGDTSSKWIDYQWLPTQRKAIIDTNESMSHSGANGLAVDINGDWLMLTPSGIDNQDDSHHGAVIWRSSDRGKRWTKGAVLPNNDYRQLFVTSQGRIVTYGEHWGKPGTAPVHHRKQGSDLRDDPPGRRRVAQASSIYVGIKMSIAYSDDKGKTWRSTFIDGGPLHYISSHCDGNFHEAGNGDLIFPVRGWFKETGPWGWTAATGYIRSSDGGETWSPPCIVFKDDGQQSQWFNETAVLPRRSGPWFAIARTNPMLRVQKPGSHGFLGGYRSRSYDEGKTWILPEPTMDAIGYPRLLELKDGGILIAASRWGPSYVQVSYDHGLSSAYGLELPRSGGGIGAWIHPDEQTVVAAHTDISEKDVVLTYFTRQPTSRFITTRPPIHPENRWTMRDLKNLYLDKQLKPYVSSIRCEDGTIVVAGATDGPHSQVIVIRSTDPWHEWSTPSVVAQANTYLNIYPMCMTTTADGSLMIVCTEADDRLDHPEIFPLGKDQWGTPTLVRTLVSRDSGKSWSQVNAIESAGTVGCLRPGSRIVKDELGRLVLPVSAVNRDGLSVCGTLRWQGVESGWSCFQMIAQPEKTEDIFDQPAVLFLGKGRWLGVFRANLAEYQVEHQNTKGRTLRQPPLWCVRSENGGKTWTQPGHLWSVHYPHLLNLPDGALMMTDISGSHLQYRVSYNQGLSWSFEDTVIHYPTYNLYQGRFAMSDLSMVVLDERTLLGTYFCNDDFEGGPRLVATWFRALPSKSPEARERGL